MSDWYVLPFGITCAAVAIRLVGKLAMANKRSQARQASMRRGAVAS